MTSPRIVWGALDAKERGPVVACPAPKEFRNTIGAYSGEYSIHRGLSVATGMMSRNHRPNLTDTQPVVRILPCEGWKEIVAFDPFGHLVCQVFADELAAGMDVWPTIAVAAARITVPEIHLRMARGAIKADGKILLNTGEINVVKVAIEPVWYLPGVAARLGVSEVDLRTCIYEQSGEAYAPLVNSPELKVFLPAMGGVTVYILGNVERIRDPSTEVVYRPHDECHGSDVFGSSICTCRPYLMFAAEECVRTAQRGGVGIISYHRNEGRSLGEVIKFLVYNARSRQVEGDRPEAYFARTESVAGIQDARFQALMPDVIRWLGVKTIHRLFSMSCHKHDALRAAGINVGGYVEIRHDVIPDGAQTEIQAKVQAGYHRNDPLKE